MSLKIVLPWLCAAAALAGVGGLYLSNNKLNADLNQARAENQELQQAKAASEASGAQAQAQNEELARLRKDNEDLLRLRNEARQLRQEKQQLAAQLQTAQAQAAQGQGQMRVWNTATGALVTGTTTSTPEQQAATAAFKARYGLQATQMLTGEQVVINACVNNLRQIDAAKQQWALENNKPANTLVGEVNITPYLPGNVMPTCPSGGTYTINAVGVAPTCSVAGHQLGK